MKARGAIFRADSFVDGSSRWGWACYGCHAETALFGNLTAARQALDIHLATCAPAAALYTERPRIDADAADSAESL